MNADMAVRKAFNILSRNYSRQSVDLTACEEGGAYGGAASIIADDSDGHRQRRGLMIYPRVEICNFWDTIWILMLGEKGGSYPGNEYAIDLAAVRYWHENGKFPKFPIDFNVGELSHRLGDRNDWFQSSILTVYRDGRLRIRDKELERYTNPYMAGYVLAPQTKESCNDGLALHNRTKIGQAHTYRRDFPGSLARWIADSLFCRAEPSASGKTPTARSG